MKAPNKNSNALSNREAEGLADGCEMPLVNAITTQMHYKPEKDLD